MDSFVSFGYLGTLGGCVAIVTTFTEVVKRYSRRMSPKWWVLISSVAVISVRQGLVIADLSPHGIAEACINAGICICAASGLYEFTFKPVEHAMEEHK